MFKGVDEALEENRAARRASLAQLDGEYAAKGLFRSGPRIREVANRLGQQFEGLAHELFDIASRQPDPAAATRRILDKLVTDVLPDFRFELAEVVGGIAGGDAALHAALKILDEARERVERDAAQLIDEAQYAATGFPAAVLETEDGDVITTEDGEPIELEGDARVTADGDARVTEDGNYRVTADGTVRRTEDGERQVTEGVSFGDVVEADIVRASVPASGWTGRLSQAERVQVIKSLAPVAQSEIQELIGRVDERRFNDDLTRDALAELKRLHEMLGQLIEAAEHDKPLDKLLAAFGQSRDTLFNLLTQGANVVIAAPALTFGIVKLLAALCGVAMDGGLVGAVYAALLYKLCGKGKD